MFVVEDNVPFYYCTKVGFGLIPNSYLVTVSRTVVVGNWECSFLGSDYSGEDNLKNALQKKTW